MPYSVQSRYSYYEHMSRPHQHVLPHLQQSDWNRVIILLCCLILEVDLTSFGDVAGYSLHRALSSARPEVSGSRS